MHSCLCLHLLAVGRPERRCLTGAAGACECRQWGREPPAELPVHAQGTSTLAPHIIRNGVRVATSRRRGLTLCACCVRLRRRLPLRSALRSAQHPIIRPLAVVLKCLCSQGHRHHDRETAASPAPQGKGASPYPSALSQIPSYSRECDLNDGSRLEISFRGGRVRGC